MIRCNSATSQLYSHQRRSPSLSSLLLTSLSNIPTRSNNQSNKKEYAIMTLQSHSPLLLPIFHFIQMETPYMKRPEYRNAGMPLSIMKMPECRNATVQSYSKHPSPQNRPPNAKKSYHPILIVHLTWQKRGCYYFSEKRAHIVHEIRNGFLTTLTSPKRASAS